MVQYLEGAVTHVDVVVVCQAVVLPFCSGHLYTRVYYYYCAIRSSLHVRAGVGYTLDQGRLHFKSYLALDNNQLLIS